MRLVYALLLVAAATGSANAQGEAKRRFSALHPLKRRKFTRECIAASRR